MRFYRAHQRLSGSESNGFEFFTNRKEADRQQYKWNCEASKDYEENGDDNDSGFMAGTVTEIDITPTKMGILSALNQHFSYPDNG